MLFLDAEEGRGLDARFRRTAHVVIIVRVQLQHELQQMVGRSSRARGACEATLYSVGAERPAQVAERLRSNGAMALMELERLVALLEKRAKDQQLIRCLTDANGRGATVMTLEELRADIGEQAFARLTK